MATVEVKRLNDLATIPSLATIDSAGVDLYAATEYEIEIPPHTTVKIGTGLAFKLPKETFAGIFARSGLATKKGLAPANKVGVCDADYRGEYIVALHNHTDIPQKIEPKERIAQMILLPYIPMNFKEVNELDETERGDRGFGSSGEK